MEITQVKQAAGSLFFALLLAVVVFFIARRAGYFRLPAPSLRSGVTIFHTLGIFALFLLLGFLILPLLKIILLRFTEIGEGRWLHIGALFIVFCALIGYCYLIKENVRHSIFWGEKEPSWKRASKALYMGLLSWVVSYPFVFLTGIVTSMISLAIWNEAKVEQVAVEQLKATMGKPLLLSVMIFLVVILVPFMEELLFRGFLHSMLKRYLGRVAALLITALVFAFIHFAPSQGVGNFQLICSLFVLSLFLGFIYEREQTLWAPITLHATFNGFTVLLIFFTK